MMVIEMEEEFVCPYAYDEYSRIYHCSENISRNANLVCVECRGRVCHVRGGTKRRDHFRHVSKRGGGVVQTCHGGESMLHRLYKHYVAQNIQALRVVPLCHGCDAVCRDKELHDMFEACSAQVEHGVVANGNNYILDVGVFDNTGRVVAAVEIVKTHKCEREKRVDLACSGVTLVELFIADNDEMVRNGVLMAQCYVYKIGRMSCAGCIQAKFVVKTRTELYELQCKNGTRVGRYYVPVWIRDAMRSWHDRVKPRVKSKAQLYELQTRNGMRVGKYYVPARIRSAMRNWCYRAIAATERMKQGRVDYYYNILNGIEQTTVEMYIVCSKCKEWLVDFGKDEVVTKLLCNVKISNFKMSKDAIRYILDTQYARYSDMQSLHNDITSFPFSFTSITNREMDRMNVRVRRFRDQFRVVCISADLLNEKVELQGYDESRYYTCGDCYRSKFQKRYKKNY